MSTPKPTAAEYTRRAEMIEKCLSEGFAPMGEKGAIGSAVAEAARRMKLSSATLGEQIRRALIEPNWKAYKPPANDNVTARERVGQEDTIRRLRAEIRDIHRAELTTENVRTAIMGLASYTPSPPDWVLGGGKAKKGESTPGVPMTMWSDWHWGEVVRAEEVAGVNTFNIEIAHERVRMLVERIINLCFKHQTNAKYPGIVICLGGDMISGEIHDELTETNELRTAPAIMDLIDVLIWAIGTMADAFGRVFLPCVVGNHGRMTHKPRAKARVHTSFEWILYCQLERHFKNDKRVQFMIPGETDAHLRVAGHRYMLTHGDTLGVKGGDGMIGALGPILRGRIKTHTSEAQIGRDFDTMVIGHWHQYLPLPGCIVNGSLKGFDDFARLFLRARYQPPIQALWFTHPVRGITSHWPVTLDERHPEREGRAWVSWEAPARKTRRTIAA